MTNPLAIPGPLWGAAPLRPAGWAAPDRGWRFCLGRPAVDGSAALAHIGQQLRREGLAGPAGQAALAAVARCAAATLGQTPRANQLQAACVLLDRRLAEMPTGEGKTLAVALAAAVAALAGVPVHVVTANDYLAARDAAAMRPLFAALGLSAAARPGAGDEAARRAVYSADIVYATAHDLAFDFLRDRQAAAGRGALESLALTLAGQPPPAPAMRGLCLALLDEADSILLDEAQMPLVLSRPQPHCANPAAHQAFLWQALVLARRLAGADYKLDFEARRALLTPGGEASLAALAAPLAVHMGVWQRPRWRREAVQTALAALHLYQRSQHYLLRDGRIEVLDEISGRAAPGRVWSRGLHTLIALKENLAPPPETETVARTSFQRFFQRYWHLAGTSGTLWEARADLAAEYGLAVQRIAPHRPCRRQAGPPRCFEHRDQMFAAAAERCAALAAIGRPVLVGTDSVDDSLALAAELAARGLVPQVLNALHDADEAAIVAGAGRSGQVTVATRMAGRGTHIELDAAALAAGGLHVLSCQHNPAARLDRQLAGRAGRRGEPGSAEAWFLLPVMAGTQVLSTNADSYRPWTPTACPTFFRAWLARARHRFLQRRETSRHSALRRELLRQDLSWERQHDFAGPPD